MKLLITGGNTFCKNLTIEWEQWWIRKDTLAKGKQRFGQTVAA